MKFFMRFVVVLLINLTCFEATYSQEIWTLEKCIRRAVEQSFLIEQNKANVEDAAISNIQAKHARYPNLSASSNVGWNFGRTIDPTTNTFNNETFFNNGFNLSSGAVLYNGNRINNNIALSDKNLKAGLQDMEQAKRDIVLNVATIYLNLLFAKENLQLASVQLKQTQDQLESLERQIKVGNRPENDRFEIEAQIATNNQRLVQAENNLKIQLLTLKQILRLDMDTEIEIAQPNLDISSITDPEILTFQELVLSAVQSEPAVAANKLRVESAELSKKMADAEAIPVLSAFGGARTNYSNRGFRIGEPQLTFIDIPVTFGNQSGVLTLPQQIPNFKESPYFEQFNDNISYFVGLNLNIPIYSNYTIKAGKQRAKINIKRSQLNYEQSIENLKVTVGQALTDAKLAKARYAAAIQTLEARKNLYNNTLKRFEIGNVGTFELINNQSLMEAAVFEELTAKYEYIFRTKILDFYMGVPIESQF